MVHRWNFVLPNRIANTLKKEADPLSSFLFLIVSKSLPMDLILAESPCKHKWREIHYEDDYFICDLLIKSRWFDSIQFAR